MPKFDKEQVEEVANKGKERALEAIDKKSKGQTNLAEDWRAQLAAIEDVKKRPPLIVEKRCRVCQSEHRGYIDSILAKGNVNYSRLASGLPKNKDGLTVTRRSLKTHAEKHLNIQQGVLREIMLHEAEAQGKDWEAAVQGTFTYRGMLEATLRQFFNDMEKGVIRPEVKDALAILKVIQEMDRQAETEAVDQARATVNAFIQAIMETVPDDYWESIVSKVERLLAGSGIDLQLMAGVGDSPETVDAEVVEEPVQLTSSQEARMLQQERKVLPDEEDEWDD